MLWATAMPVHADAKRENVQVFLEIRQAEELRIEWVGAPVETILIRVGPTAEDRVVYEGAPPQRLVLQPGKYWLWSPRAGVVRITSRRLAGS